MLMQFKYTCWLLQRLKSVEDLAQLEMRLNLLKLPDPFMSTTPLPDFTFFIFMTMLVLGYVV